MSTILGLVAMNTLLFLGLSVAKVIPWPDPVHPRALRPRMQGAPSAPPPCVRQRLLVRLTAALARIG
jgi:hypothetical protein